MQPPIRNLLPRLNCIFLCMFSEVRLNFYFMFTCFTHKEKSKSTFFYLPLNNFLEGDYSHFPGLLDCELCSATYQWLPVKLLLKSSHITFIFWWHWISDPCLRACLWYITCTEWHINSACWFTAGLLCPSSCFIPSVISCRQMTAPSESDSDMLTESRSLGSCELITLRLQLLLLYFLTWIRRIHWPWISFGEIPDTLAPYCEVCEPRCNLTRPWHVDG